MLVRSCLEEEKVEAAAPDSPLPEASPIFTSVHRGGPTRYPHRSCVRLYQESAKRKRELDADHRRQLKDDARADRRRLELVELQREIQQLHTARALLKITQVEIRSLEARIVPCSCGQLIYRKHNTCGRKDCHRLRNLPRSSSVR